MAKALKINNRDNCAVLLADAKAGETVEVQTETGMVRLDARHDIALGHKITLIKLDADQPIIKYGEEIGRAMAEVGMELFEKVLCVASGEPSRAELLDHDELFCITRI